MNASWHAGHPMPENAPFDERVSWHAEHMRECGCRKPPADIAARIAAERTDEPQSAARPTPTWSRTGPPGPRSQPHRR